MSDGETGFRRGVRLGVDVGQVRVGVAVCDPDGLVATPLATLARDHPERNGPARDRTERNGTERNGTERDGVDRDGAAPTDIQDLARLVAEREVVEVVVGLPVNLAGREGPAAEQARAYARRLAGAIAPVPVRLADERMSTAVVSRRLSERGVRGRRQRAVVDQAAAAEILQGWLDAQRRRT
ncbi:Holliday junction resolvase RuvX [Rhizomonospora bruguierae]|uniref:Holliday junction resolvase RuvX n=1 Tax=Rhizomonospora bruguierae TaxID=1581705 RepID=UPI001BCD5DFE|nr:Holliday junction resolvase RuvX [Micromonospora sp. NBRC 107566]